MCIRDSCRYCALFHTEAARLHGATDEEIAEASTIAGFSMMASTYLNAQQVDYETFRKETMDIVAYAKAHMNQPNINQPNKADVGRAERGRH